MSFVERGFNWLQGVLQLSGAQAPNDLLAEIRPSVNIDQGGWGHVDTDTTPFQWTVPESTSAAVYDMLTGVAVGTAPPGDPTWQFVIHALDIVNNAVSPGDVWIQMRPAGGLAARVRGFSIPADEGGAAGYSSGAVAFGNDLLPGGRPMWVPPGYRPQLNIRWDTGESDSITVTGLYTKMRSGFIGGAP